MRDHTVAHGLDGYEISGNKKKKEILCVNPASKGKLCLAHSCISTESRGLIRRAVLNLSGSRGKRDGESELESPSVSGSELCRAAEIDPGSRFTCPGKVNQTHC